MWRKSVNPALRLGGIWAHSSCTTASAWGWLTYFAICLLQVHPQHFCGIKVKNFDSAIAKLLEQFFGRAACVLRVTNHFSSSMEWLINVNYPSHRSFSLWRGFLTHSLGPEYAKNPKPHSACKSGWGQNSARTNWVELGLLLKRRRVWVDGAMNISFISFLPVGVCLIGRR